MRGRLRIILASLLLACTLAAGCGPLRFASAGRRRQVRQALFAELTPAALANCTLRRYGEPDDGGYLMCENLMSQAEAAYSYGIDGRDQWGCDLSRQLHATVHEFDCFNTTRVACDGGSLLFHEDCVGQQANVRNGRRFDSLTNQIAQNGDSARHLIVKIDVEGDEWRSLLAMREAALATIDQLVVEFHGVDQDEYLRAVRWLKQDFYVAHLHANNHACAAGIEPFTAWANEVLFVNKRLGALASSEGPPRWVDPLDAPNKPADPDCQPGP